MGLFTTSLFFPCLFPVLGSEILLVFTQGPFMFIDRVNQRVVRSFEISEKIGSWVPIFLDCINVNFHIFCAMIKQVMLPQRCTRPEVSANL